MSKQFSPKLVFRLFTPSLLNGYFTARQQSQLHVAEDTPDIDGLYQQWEALSPEIRYGMEAELRDVHDMANSDTDLTTVLQEAEHHGVAEDLRRTFTDLASLHDRMLWTLLKHPRVFEVARLFEKTDYLSARYWRKRIGLPKRDPRTEGETCQALAAALRTYYVDREGRGRNCHVEPLKRGTDIYYYVYLEDYARTGVTFDNHGQYQRRALQDSFEIIFRFSPVEGSLEAFVHGSRQLVEDIQTIFARTCLECDLPRQPRSVALYEFNRLLQPHPFPTDPVDGVLGVRVKSLRLYILGLSRRRMTLEEGDPNNRYGVYELLDTIVADEARGKPGLRRALLNVTRAELQMVFRGDAGRNKKLTFAISYPDGCTLKDGREDQIAKKYLRQWGLELHGITENALNPVPVG